MKFIESPFVKIKCFNLLKEYDFFSKLAEEQNTLTNILAEKIIDYIQKNNPDHDAIDVNSPSFEKLVKKLMKKKFIELLCTEEYWRSKLDLNNPKEKIILDSVTESINLLEPLGKHFKEKQYTYAQELIYCKHLSKKSPSVIQRIQGSIEFIGNIATSISSYLPAFLLNKLTTATESENKLQNNHDSLIITENKEQILNTRKKMIQKVIEYYSKTKDIQDQFAKQKQVFSKLLDPIRNQNTELAQRLEGELLKIISIDNLQAVSSVFQEKYAKLFTKNLDGMNINNMQEFHKKLLITELLCNFPVFINLDLTTKSQLLNYLYKEINSLIVSPSDPNYELNLKNVANIIQGIFLKYSTPKEFLELENPINWYQWWLDGNISKNIKSTIVKGITGIIYNQIENNFVKISNIQSGSNTFNYFFNKVKDVYYNPLGKSMNSRVVKTLLLSPVIVAGVLFPPSLLISIPLVTIIDKFTSKLTSKIKFLNKITPTEQALLMFNEDKSEKNKGKAAKTLNLLHESLKSIEQMLNEGTYYNDNEEKFLKELKEMLYQSIINVQTNEKEKFCKNWHILSENLYKLDKFKLKLKLRINPVETTSALKKYTNFIFKSPEKPIFSEDCAKKLITEFNNIDHINYKNLSQVKPIYEKNQIQTFSRLFTKYINKYKNSLKKLDLLNNIIKEDVLLQKSSIEPVSNLPMTMKPVISVKASTESTETASVPKYSKPILISNNLPLNKNNLRFKNDKKSFYQQIGLDLKKINGDGSCFYHAIAHILTQENPAEPKKQEDIRNMAYEILINKYKLSKKQFPSKYWYKFNEIRSNFIHTILSDNYDTIPNYNIEAPENSIFNNLLQKITSNQQLNSKEMKQYSILVEKYIHKVKFKDNNTWTWADQTTINAVAEKLKRPIYIIEPVEPKDSKINVTPIYNENFFDAEPIFIERVNKNHYNALTAKDGKKTKDILKELPQHLSRYNQNSTKIYKKA